MLQTLRMGPHTLLLLATMGALCEGADAEQCVADSCFGVFCVCPIDRENCAHPAVCATLFFYNETGGENEIARLQGTKDYKKGLKKKSIGDVVSVQQIGTGCYRIYNGKKFNDGSLELVGNSMFNLEEYNMDTTIK